MSTTEVTGRIVSIERLNSSYSGNPRFRITLQSDSGMGTWNTSADSSFAYEVGNPGLRTESVVTLSIGGRGTIVGMVTGWPTYEVALPDGRRIGRTSLTGELGPVARGFAYGWVDLATATELAERFGGTVVVR